MATYTITINERTREGKGLVNYLKTLGVKRQERPFRKSEMEKALYAIHLRNILKQSNETQDCHFQPVQERY